jgi:hypothetical protein
LESKKLPPLSAEKAEPLCWAGWAEGRGDVKEPRLEKASFWAGFGDGALAKLRLLKASFIPPMEPCIWLMPGEGIPPIDPDGAWEIC